VAGAPLRLWPEIQSAIPGWGARLRFSAAYAARIARFPAVPSAMAARIEAARGLDHASACARVQSPTLVVTGELALDHVVPVETTREYLRLIPGAQYEMMAGTGHVGLVTQPERFAELVSNFIDAADK
jgi:3-oxoadipate enol-lactonase